MGRSRLALLLLAAAATSGAAGYVRGARTGHDAGYVLASLESDVNSAAAAVRTLRAAEKHEIDEANALLEDQVDFALVRMSRYGHWLEVPFYATTEPGMHDKVRLLVRELAKHRKGHPRDSDPIADAEVRMAAERLASAR